MYALYFDVSNTKNKAIIGCLIPTYIKSDLNNNMEDCLHLF